MDGILNLERKGVTRMGGIFFVCFFIRKRLFVKIETFQKGLRLSCHLAGVSDCGEKTHSTKLLARRALTCYVGEVGSDRFDLSPRPT